MKTICSCFLIVTCFSGTVVAEEENAIRVMLEKRATAWQEKNVPDLIKNYADNADYVSSSGEHTTGKAAIEKRYKELFSSGRYDGVSTKQTISRISQLRPNLAVVDAEWSASGLTGPDGKELPERKGRSIVVLIKENDAWKIISLRASLIPDETAK